MVAQVEKDLKTEIRFPKPTVVDTGIGHPQGMYHQDKVDVWKQKVKERLEKILDVNVNLESSNIFYEGRKGLAKEVLEMLKE